MKGMKIMNQSELKKNRNNYSRRMFTCEEDEKLKELVKKYENDWQKISKEMKDRNIRQCKERYNHYLSPNIKHSEWNLEEDLKLIEIVEEVGKKWKVFEQYFPGRTEIDIRNRFHVLFRSITKQTKKQLYSFKVNCKDIQKPKTFQYQNKFEKEMKCDIPQFGLSNNNSLNSCLDSIFDEDNMNDFSFEDSFDDFFYQVNF